MRAYRKAWLTRLGGPGVCSLYLALYTMEEATSIRLVSQFLFQNGFLLSLEALERESGRKYEPDECATSGELQAILDNHAVRLKQRLALDVSPSHLFEPGQGEHARKMLKSFEDVGCGANILVVRLIEDGVLIFGAAKALFGVAELNLPISMAHYPIFSINSTFCRGAILTIDIHPTKRNLVACGSMDRLALILDISQPEENMVLHQFQSHSKYVVRVLWSPSGTFLITASYDKTICVYSFIDENEKCKEIQKLHYKGAIESLAFCTDSDTFVVGVRDDCILHCYSLTSGFAKLCREINMNSFGDDYVSFVPMHISFSPNGQFMLISTDHDRLVIYSWTNGKQITSFYGASNDELSQPRNCWDYTGKYVYGTSQDKSIVVWEVRSQNIVCKLEGHSSTVRDIFYCNNLKVLVSCGFDGSIKLWTS